ncbi:Cyclophilin-like peptidyl-prolyl cis-trans isomerase domain [Pseudocohnilembus persalinus]|uniref:Cyclophilin-like peptidyl-prolyl cis-trans isomerase domain n=1 Tax=Pseudocohnilembus persalinus TaxID=266149 RepID=A0A0V0QP27_PSEPJ|nr:Cyclophilin-like peptidyl-prolyl cis-trans isomerase domain [Pseudocohnilembus persalinus]|eukprot:KRX03733.1 Cyclophilin-like peptidyl-prolyl cis-trans isomerase domain [Pseudocohnilembus persalinus]
MELKRLKEHLFNQHSTLILKLKINEYDEVNYRQVQKKIASTHPWIFDLKKFDNFFDIEGHTHIIDKQNQNNLLWQNPDYFETNFNENFYFPTIIDDQNQVYLELPQFLQNFLQFTLGRENEEFFYKELEQNLSQLKSQYPDHQNKQYPLLEKENSYPYSKQFSEEKQYPFFIQHEQPGILSMFNHNNQLQHASKFFITKKPAQYLDSQNVSFGKVLFGYNKLLKQCLKLQQNIDQSLNQGQDLDNLSLQSYANFQIIDCGIYEFDAQDFYSKNGRLEFKIKSHLDQNSVNYQSNLFQEIKLEKNVWNELNNNIEQKQNEKNFQLQNFKNNLLDFKKLSQQEQQNVMIDMILPQVSKTLEVLGQSPYIKNNIANMIIDFQENDLENLIK